MGVGVVPALRAGLDHQSELASHVATHPGEKGIRRLRRALGLADPRSESPMETRLRLELIMARLPRPSVQSELSTRRGNSTGPRGRSNPAPRPVIYSAAITPPDPPLPI